MGKEWVVIGVCEIGDDVIVIVGKVFVGGDGFKLIGGVVVV